MDLGTGLTVFGSAPLVQKLLGPTADYLGDGLKEWTERGLKNANHVFEKARFKLGPKIDDPGAVPPKVLKGILAEAPFRDDELSAEYFGGVLASSRSEVGRDDRGAAFIALIGRLSSYQIRTHFFFYSVIRLLYEGSGENIGNPESRARLRTFVPFSSYVKAMEFGGKEKAGNILSHVMFGLAREALIAEQFFFGDAVSLHPHFNGADSEGILFAPSALGSELFLWALGRGDLASPEILDATINFTCSTKLKMTGRIRSTEFPERVFSRPEAPVAQASALDASS